jgi:hypothetical protein
VTDPLQQVAQWVEAYRHLWEDSFDRLDAHLKAAQSAKTKDRKHVGK